MNFEAYLSSKKIDSAAFRKAEPVLWDSWKKEFEQLHPNSFTAQKLYLINPIRRKYHQAIEALPEVLKSVEAKLPVAPPVKSVETSGESTGTEQVKPKPVVARPMMKPKLPTATPSSGETTSAAPTSTPPARPEMPKPVIKPKPVTDESIKSDAAPATDIPPAIEPLAETKSEQPVSKPMAKPVIPRPVIKPKPATDETIKNETLPATDIPPVIEPLAETKSEQPPASKPTAKPVIPRPVIKPKPATEESIKNETPPATDIPAAIEPLAETKSEQPPVSKPMAKPVIPRPVIKPKIPAPEAEQKAEQTTEPLHDSTHTTTTPTPPSETPPAKAAKPAIPRPVIKPPKPKTD